MIQIEIARFAYNVVREVTMAIIWGFGGKSKNPGGLWVPFFCSRCDRLASFSVVENYRYGQVYGIRIAKYKAKYFLVCTTCDRVIPIDTKDRFIAAQMIGTAIQGDPSFTEMTVMKYVANVARQVLGDSELANSIESDLTKELE